MVVHKLPSKEREQFLGKIKKATSEDYITEYDTKGSIVKQKKKSNIKKGKKSKNKGGQFEQRVRKNLEEKGWIVDKWSNNIQFDKDEKGNNMIKTGRIAPAKRVFNPFKKVMTIGTGFPDFIALQQMSQGRHKVIGIEVKINGTLSREEKQKAKWYMDNEVFAEFLIAKKIKEKNRIRVEYIDINKILARMR